ncbi:hypothetical protein BVC93_20240 [Mycobacterium sp. MS1601]|uniref:hypothetical protein n=1 Tax=Mycobacterium sp. MS1601 TaxID=1936029 RepID=UPI00097939CF|nr:hypothetical protein [Mycobacterium sp. MS1601]AQA04367.1 hypothetical protein BVC93_20240 [Mycobacterium sp. MS1601]
MSDYHRLPVADLDAEKPDQIRIDSGVHAAQHAAMVAMNEDRHSKSERLIAAMMQEANAAIDAKKNAAEAARRKAIDDFMRRVQ